jgi:hypothetical protein
VRFVQIASVLVAGALVLSTLPAEAQSRHIRKNNWRQRGRGGGIYKGTPQYLALELRGGPYYPAVDEEFGGPGPYARYFGDEWRLFLGAEIDWQAYRIPWVGTIGPGFGVGYMSATEKAYADGVLSDGDPSNDETRAGETTLNIMPMHLSVVLRIDELFRRTQFPFVPYAKIGLGYGLWWCTAGSNDCKVVNSSGAETLGSGASYGVHWALGGSVPLDFLGRREMSALDQETGVNHIHIFAEWYNQNLGLGANQMRIGTSTWMTGMVFEM